MATSKDLKRKILTEALNLVPIYGWSEELLKNAEDAAAAQNVFVSIKDLVEYHLEQNDELLQKKLDKLDPKKLKVRERIKQALLFRFELHDKEIIKETIKFLMHPKNADLAFASLASTCDKIWIWAGDESTDFNYYTKRTLLGAVYSTSLAYYLKKDEKDEITKEKLETFIDKRISEVLRLGDMKATVKRSFGVIRDWISTKS